ncbi:hypothetical protein NDU88_002295 [Pleurodeles waltl]|uniref:Uncharacterized protein n=1 Tax=Pleurodeles waltl TaxID=8319 RepID=A0AAV7MNF5_PLEWA|nr:hypothetical protein NDU88_002295 [Pleurodeles waltl]
MANRSWDGILVLPLGNIVLHLVGLGGLPEESVLLLGIMLTVYRKWRFTDDDSRTLFPDDGVYVRLAAHGQKAGR